MVRQRPRDLHKPQALHGHVVLPADPRRRSGVEERAVAVTAERPLRLPGIAFVVGVHRVEVQLAGDVVDEGQRPHHARRSCGRVDHVAWPAAERGVEDRISVAAAAVGHAALVPPEALVPRAGCRARAGRVLLPDAVEQRGPLVHVCKRVGPGRRHQAAYVRRILAQLSRLLRHARERRWRRLVLDVPEEPIEPAPLAEVLLPLPAPGSPLRPGEAGGLAQLYRRPARSSRGGRAVEERRHFGVVARPIDADVVAALAERGRILGAPEESDAPPQGDQVVGAGQLARRIDVAAVSLRGRVSGEPERGGERRRGRQIEGADADLYWHVRRPAAPGEPDRARQARRSGSPRHAGLDEDGLRATGGDVDGKRVPFFAVDGVSDRDQRVRPFAGSALWPGRMLENDGGDAIQIEMRLAARRGGQAGHRALHHQLSSDALATGGDKTDARVLRRGRRARIGTHLGRFVRDPDLQRSEDPEHGARNCGALRRTATCLAVSSLALHCRNGA